MHIRVRLLGYAGLALLAGTSLLVTRSAQAAAITSVCEGLAVVKNDNSPKPGAQNLNIIVEQDDVAKTVRLKIDGPIREGKIQNDGSIQFRSSDPNGFNADISVVNLESVKEDDSSYYASMEETVYDSAMKPVSHTQVTLKCKDH
jgi:hypothetical protein